MYKIIFLIGLFLALWSCQSESGKDKKLAPSEVFRIARNQVGPVRRGMTIKQLRSELPDYQMKKLESRSELSNETSNNYYIYDDSTRLLFIVSPQRKNDENSRINRVIIKDDRYKTKKGIGLSSTVGEIRAAYPDSKFLPSVDDIILYIRELDANFELDERYLSPIVWNDTTGQILADSIPADTRITDLSITWRYDVKNLTDKMFWSDLFHHGVNWVVTQVPSIIILTLIFIGLLKLLRLIVRKVEKSAKDRLEKNNRPSNLEGEKRINTITGITYGLGKILLWTIYLLILLAKFNINIGPILASAGIVGLAVGFGAQELVRDFISGFFMLLEDQIRTGDIVTINNTSGTVEKMELRTTTLRDASGIVHIFQNGKINTLSNMTKEWSAIVVDIGVAYKEDTDHVSEVLQKVADDLRKDPEFGSKIINIENWGVDQFADSAVILKIKISTQEAQQWSVSREYRRRVKKAFDANNIEIPFPHLSLYTGSLTKPMPIDLKEKEENKN